MGLDERSYLDLEIDEKNDIIFSWSRDLPLDEVTGTFDATCQETFDLLAGMSFEELQRPILDYMNGSAENSTPTVLDEVLGTTRSHYDEHREWIKAIL